MWSDPQFTLVTFTKEIPKRKLHFLCSGNDECAAHHGEAYLLSYQESMTLSNT